MVKSAFIQFIYYGTAFSVLKTLFGLKSKENLPKLKKLIGSKKSTIIFAGIRFTEIDFQRFHFEIN